MNILKNKQKRVLMLGGSHFQVPAIKYARRAGYYVITADYLPQNPGHKFADKYCNVSTVDQHAILDLAKQEHIDGIISYASDPGAPTAAFVAAKLDLPGNPYESVRILQRKDLFRRLLKKLGYPVPKSESFHRDALETAREYAKELLGRRSAIVKPVDSSGSKGVSKVESIEELEAALSRALSFSRSKTIVIEEFIDKSLYEMDGDGFVWQGRLAFWCFGNQHNDVECNPYVPSGISFPYIQPRSIQEKAAAMVSRIMSHLDMRVGGLNIEYLTTHDGEVYLLEIGPRSGGNRIPEVIEMATGVSLIAHGVEGALGEDLTELRLQQPRGFFSSYLLHSRQNGTVAGIVEGQEARSLIRKRDVFVKPGDDVNRFDGSNDTLGSYILEFTSQSQMLTMMDTMHDYLHVSVSPS